MAVISLTQQQMNERRGNRGSGKSHSHHQPITTSHQLSRSLSTSLHSKNTQIDLTSIYCSTASTLFPSSYPLASTRGAEAANNTTFCHHNHKHPAPSINAATLSFLTMAAHQLADELWLKILVLTPQADRHRTASVSERFQRLVVAASSRIRVQLEAPSKEQDETYWQLLQHQPMVCWDTWSTTAAVWRAYSLTTLHPLSHNCRTSLGSLSLTLQVQEPLVLVPACVATSQVFLPASLGLLA